MSGVGKAARTRSSVKSPAKAAGTAGRGGEAKTARPTPALRRRGRRTQPERRAAMRARLLDATVQCLVEVGWAGTTLPEVVARAGVGRGAQVHHFPTKAELIGAVGDHLLVTNQRQFLAAFEALEPAERTIDAALDVLWNILQSHTWTAVMELGVASRTDPVAAAAFRGFTDKVDAVVWEVVATYFPTLAALPIGTAVVRGALAMLVGLAVQASIDGDRQGRHAALFAQFKALCQAMAPALAGIEPSKDTEPASPRRRATTATSSKIGPTSTNRPRRSHR